MAGSFVAVNRHDIAAPGANTDILSTALTPPMGTTLMRIFVVLATGSVFNVMLNGVGGTVRTAKQNGGTPLTASVAMAFEMPISRDVLVGAASTTVLQTVNFQVETNGIIHHLVVAFVNEGS